MQRIEHGGRHLCIPGFHLLFRPVAVEPDRSGYIFGKRLPVVPFANQYVANQPPSGEVEYAPAGLISSIRQAEQNLTLAAIFFSVIPCLWRIDLGMVPFRSLLLLRFYRLHFVGWIEIKNPLARIADHRLLTSAHFVIGLWPQHYLAGHALMITHL